MYCIWISLLNRSGTCSILLEYPDFRPMGLLGGRYEDAESNPNPSQIRVLMANEGVAGIRIGVG